MEKKILIINGVDHEFEYDLQGDGDFSLKMLKDRFPAPSYELRWKNPPVGPDFEWNLRFGATNGHLINAHEIEIVILEDGRILVRWEYHKYTNWQ